MTHPFTRFAVVATLAALGLWVAGTAPAQACSCARQTSPERFVAQTGAIFEGVPSKIEVVYKRGSDGRIFWPNEAIRSTIHVTRVFKGNVPRIVVIHSYVGSSLCGWQPVAVGRPQLFATFVRNGRFSAGSCTMGLLHGSARGSGPRNPFVAHILKMPSRPPR